MKNAILGSDFKQVDKFSIEVLGIPSLVLMERAAYSVYEEIQYLCTKKDRILVVCGTGNNGADGLAVARMLHIEGYNVEYLVIGNKDKATEEFKIQENINKNINIKTINEIGENYKIIVEGIFGIGLKRDIKEKFKELIFRINESGSMIISIDVPAGLCADSGKVMGISIKADLTITFGLDKIGLLTSNAMIYAGGIIVKKIGFPSEAFKEVKKDYKIYEKSDLKLIPERQRDSNKGTYGKILVIAGSQGMSGAAFLSSLAAYRMGAGLVRIFTEENNREILQRMIPEATMQNYSIDDFDFDILDEELKKADVIIVGPGIGKSNISKKIVKKVLNINKPTVLDADALNIISEQIEMESLYHSNITITPHVGEMSRLIKTEVDDIKENSISICEDYAKKFGIVCVLKDARTMISNGTESYINISGNPGMSTAGTGDVLTGIIGALLSLGLNTIKAASLGVYLHGLAGDIMSESLSEHSLMASDLVDGLKYLTGEKYNEF